MDNRLICPGCKTTFEQVQIVDINGLMMLRIGSLIIREAQCVCLSCGRIIYWSISNKVIAQIIKAVIIHANETAET